VLLLSGNVLFGAGLIVHAFLFNFYLRELNLPATVMGHQVAAMTLGGLFALLPAGAVVDRFGTRVALIMGAAATCIGLALTALARGTAPIYVAAFVTGMGAVACRVSWGPAIMRLASGPARSRAFTWNVAVLIGSSAALTYLSGVLLDRPWMHVNTLALSPTQLTLLAGAALTALSLICYALLRLPATEPSTPVENRRGSVSLPRENGLWLLVPLVALWMVAAALVLPFFNVFFTDRFGLGVANVGAIFASGQLVTAVVLVVAAELARRFGPRRMLLTWMGALAPALLVLAIGGPLWFAVAAYVAQGLVAPATNPLIDQLLLERAPRDRQGVVASWRNGAAEAAGAFGASTGGRVLDAASFPTLFLWAAAVAAVSAMLLAGALRPMPRGARLATDAETA